MKTKNNRKLLIENINIRSKRISYLAELRRHREKGRPIVFIDETYILTNHVSSKDLYDDSNQGLMQPLQKREVFDNNSRRRNRWICS